MGHPSIAKLNTPPTGYSLHSFYSLHSNAAEDISRKSERERTKSLGGQPRNHKVKTCWILRLCVVTRWPSSVGSIALCWFICCSEMTAVVLNINMYIYPQTRQFDSPESDNNNVNNNNYNNNNNNNNNNSECDVILGRNRSET